MILFLLNHSRFTIDIRYVPGTKYKLWNLVIALFIIFIHQCIPSTEIYRYNDGKFFKQYYEYN